MTNIYSHWSHPSGGTYTKETMRETAINTFKQLLEKEAQNSGNFSDGSLGQMKAFHQTMLASLQEEKKND